MTGRLEKMTEMVGEHTLAELERRQRASAPTLRDLFIAAQTASLREDLIVAGNAGPADFRATKHH